MRVFLKKATVAAAIAGSLLFNGSKLDAKNTQIDNNDNIENIEKTAIQTYGDYDRALNILGSVNMKVLKDELNSLIKEHPNENIYVGICGSKDELVCTKMAEADALKLYGEINNIKSPDKNAIHAVKTVDCNDSNGLHCIISFCMERTPSTYSIK